MQSYGSLEEVINPYPLLDKFKSFGFEVSEFDGHEIDDIKSKLIKRILHVVLQMEFQILYRLKWRHLKYILMS